MRDFTHDSNFKDKPKWKRALINAKWSYIKLDRKLHGRLTMVLIIVVILAVYAIATNQPPTDDQNKAYRIAECLMHGGCISHA